MDELFNYLEHIFFLLLIYLFTIYFYYPFPSYFIVFIVVFYLFLSCSNLTRKDQSRALLSVALTLLCYVWMLTCSRFTICTWIIRSITFRYHVIVGHFILATFSIHMLIVHVLCKKIFNKTLYSKKIWERKHVEILSVF